MKKHTLRNYLSLAVAAALALSLAACGGTSSSSPSGAAPSASASAAGGAGSVKIGIIQYAPHPSLDNCTKGIVQGLSDAGYTDGQNGVSIDIQNGQGDKSNTDMMAKNMVSEGYNLIIAVATPAAMSAYSAARDADVPVVFSAVSDPVAAGLVQSLDTPQSGATGTSDSLNLAGQMKMIRALLPEAKTIGVLYTTSEPNSVSHLKTFKELAGQYGFTIEDVGITNESEVASGAAALVARDVDCVNNFTDNNVVNNLSTLLHATDEAGIPVFGSEEEQVRNGCVASETLDYVSLGVTTGQMAASILDGADVNTMAVSVVADSTPVYSAAACEKFGITIPEAYTSADNLDQ